MTRVTLYCSRDPRRLLESAASGFLERRPGTADQPFPSVPYLLALRQGGLRDDLIARAAELGVPGWWDPPLCTFAELPARLGLPATEPIGDFARLVLLDAVVREAAPGLLARVTRRGAFLDALDQLIGELIQEGTDPDRLATALTDLAAHDELDRRRNAELAALYRAWRAALHRHGLRDPRAARVDCAAWIEKHPELLARALHGRREIRLLGLHDTRGGWRILLHTLAHSAAVDRVLIYGADPAVGTDLDATIEWLDDRASLADHVFEQDRSDAASVEIVSAPDPERAVEEVAVRVRMLLDQGVAPAQVAVVSRKARPLVDLAVDALGRAGVPAAARRRIGFVEIPAVRALAVLFTAAAEGWTRHALAELAAQPYLRTGLDQRLVNFLGFERRIEGLDQWLTAFDDLLTRTARRQSGEDDERRKPLPPPDRVTRARDAFREFVELARPLDEARSLRAWIAWLAECIDQDRWGIERAIHRMVNDRWDVVRRDLAGWRALGRAVAQWRDAEARWGHDEQPLPAKAFHDRLRELLSADAALWTPTHRGVRVLESLAAAYRAFDHVFLIGLEAGSFPARQPSTPILDEREREELARRGVPLETAAVWERHERALFRLMLGAAPAVTLCHARLDDRGREVAPSSYLETVRGLTGAVPQEIATSRVVTPGFPLWTTPPAGRQAEHGAFIERERACARPGPYNGLITRPDLLQRIARRLGEDYVWSPTQLESYAKCPWAWFSGRLLRLELFEDPDVDMDAATRGSVLHDALKRLFDGLREERGGPVFLLEDDLPAVRTAAVQALDQAIAAGGTQWLGHPALRASKREELVRILTEYLAFEVGENGKSLKPNTKAGKTVRMAVDAHELAFDQLVFEREGVRLKLRGSIDRVEVAHDDEVARGPWIAAVDYKSSVWSMPALGKETAWDDAVALQVPLYAWAIERLRPGSRAARAEYRALRKPAIKLAVRLVSVNRKTREVTEDPEERRKVERALDAVARHVAHARAGNYPAKYAASCGCPSWCHGWDICRVPGGPQSPFDW